MCSDGVLLDITDLDFFVYGESPLHCSLAMREEEKLLEETPELWVRLADETMKEHIRPLLHGLEGQELLIPHLQGQEL